MKVGICSLGCKVNIYESELVTNILKNNNYEIVDFEKMEISSFDSHTRAFVKIQDGCNAFCSYCIIPYTRGRVRSKNKDDVIREVTKLVNDGYKEIVLTGIHTGKYGR